MAKRNFRTKKYTKCIAAAAARESNPTWLSLLKTDVVGRSSLHFKAGQASETGFQSCVLLLADCQPLRIIKSDNNKNNCQVGG
jgi:hypothetical protein